MFSHKIIQLIEGKQQLQLPLHGAEALIRSLEYSSKTGQICPRYYSSIGRMA